jgi:hypothetical protein
MASPCLTLVLELSETDTPSGTARLPGGPRLEFHGWLGLASAITSLANSSEDGPIASAARDQQTPPTTTAAATPKGRSSG